MGTIRTFLAGCFGMMVLSSAALALQNASGEVYTAPQSAAAAHDQLVDGYTKFQNNDFTGALESLKSVVGSAGFALLNEEEQHAGYLLLGSAELQTGDAEAALKSFQISTQSPEASGLEWHHRLSAAYQLGEDDDSITSLTTIAIRWPTSLSEINDQPMLNIGKKAAAKSDTTAIALLEPLHQLHWTPKDKFWIPDSLWFALAAAYENTGDQVHANAALNDIHDVGYLIRIRADKRFDAAVRADPKRYDIAAGIAAEVARIKQAAAEAPDVLEGVNTVADVLIKVGRASEALDLLDAAIAQANKGSDTSRFSDYEDQINWTYNQRARALAAVGRHDEALNQLATGARLPEKGRINVSQAINLADTYDANGRPQDALNAVTGVELAKPSPYGLMALERARACAYAQLKEDAALKKSLAYMNAHASDAPGELLQVSICANDLDEAAKLVIKQLQDPDTRDDILFELQDYQELPGRTTIERQADARLIAIRNRPDVSRALTAVGRVEAYPLTPSD